MNDCQIRGCRKLEWVCKDCGRMVASADFPHAIEWISVKDRPAPAMETVLLCIDGKVVPGWNESVQPEESPSYCTWEGEGFGAEGVTHWALLPETPK